VDNSEKEDGYFIFVSGDDGHWAIQMPANTSGMPVIGLKPSSLYQFEVQAFRRVPRGATSAYVVSPKVVSESISPQENGGPDVQPPVDPGGDTISGTRYRYAFWGEPEEFGHNTYFYDVGNLVFNGGTDWSTEPLSLSVDFIKEHVSGRIESTPPGGVTFVYDYQNDEYGAFTTTVISPTEATIEFEDTSGRDGGIVPDRDGFWGLIIETQTGDINDDGIDDPPDPTIPYVWITSSSSVREGEGVPLTFTVYRHGGDETQALTVKLHSFAGTALSGFDYSGAQNEITIPANASSASFQIGPSQDSLNEGHETVEAILAASDDYLLTHGYRATGVILDDGYGFDVDIDSDNTSSGLPERTPAEEEAENDPNSMGKVIVVNSADRDGDGIIDMADTAVSNGKFVPVVIELPVASDAEYGLSISYSASDPATSGTAAADGTYVPAQGLFRLWSKDGGQTRDPSSIRDGGSYVGPGDYSASDLQLFGVSNTKRIVTLYLEAIRPTATTASPDKAQIEVTLTEAGSPWVTESVAVTSVDAFANSAFDEHVRADGSIRVENTDFTSNGFDGPWGSCRAFSTAPEYNLLAPIVGNGWSLAEVPRLLQATSTMIAIIGSQVIYFDAIASGYQARFGEQSRLMRIADEYLLLLPDGGRFTFHSFDKPTPQRGMPRSYRSPGGHDTLYAYDEDGYLTSITRGEGAESELYSVSWTGSGEDQKVYSIAVSNGASDPWRLIKFTYLAGDLQTAGVWDTKANTVSTDDELIGLWHYRYTEDHLLTNVVDLAGAVRTANGGSIPPSGDVDSGSLLRFAYDGRVVQSQYVRGAGASGVNAGQGQYVYGGFSVNSNASVNAWKYRYTKTFPDGATTETVATNSAGQPMLVSTALNNHVYQTFHEYDRQGRLRLTAMPSAVVPIDLLNADASDATLNHVRPEQGVVYRTTYDSNGWVIGEFIRHGYSNAASDIKLKGYSYTTRSFGGQSIQLLATETNYRGVSSSGSFGLTTSYDYDLTNGGFWEFQPVQVTITAPSAEGQNGSASVVIRSFTDDGRLESVTDEAQNTTSYQYDRVTGARTLTTLPLSGSPTIEVTAFDHLGRPTAIQDARGGITGISYKDATTYREQITTPPASSNGASAPVQVVREDFVANVIDTFTLTRDKSTVLSLVRQTLDESGRVAFSDRFYQVAADGSSPAITYDVNGGGIDLHNSTAYYRTEYRYDANGNRSYEKNANGTIRTTSFDGLGRRTSDNIGDTVIRTYEYDGGGAGDSNLTKVTEKPDADSALDRVTVNAYDWRNRLVAVANGVQLTTYTLDNLGRITSTRIYDDLLADVSLQSDGSAQVNADGDVAVSSDAALRSRVDVQLDNQGNVYRSTQYSVSQTNGAVDGSVILVTNIFHDGRGLVTKTIAPGGLTTRYSYDELGRQTLASTGTSSTIVEKVETEYDDNDNPILITTSQRQPDGLYRASYVGNWYDEADRLIATADVGTNGGSAYVRDEEVPGRSDALRLTSFAFDASGNIEWITDARGVQTKQAFDALGRVKRRVEGYVDNTPSTTDDQVTDYEYNGLDQQTLIRRETATGPNRDTVMIYADDRLYVVRHPDYTPSTVQSTSDTYLYNNLDELIYQADHRGPTHTYTRDGVGRVTAESLHFENLNSIESLVKSRKFEYDVLGNLTKATSYSDENTQGAVVNQIKRTYDGFGSVLADYQEPNGPVTSATLAVRYAYQYTDGAPRMVKMTFPTSDAQANTGRAIWYGYESIDAMLGRPTWISDTQAGGNQILERYTYLGTSGIASRSRPLNDSTTQQLEQSYLGSGGLSSFGEVAQQKWTLGGSSPQTPLDLQYWYDGAGNVLARSDAQNPTYSELYHTNGSTASPSDLYNKLNQLTAYARGTIDGSIAGRPNHIDPVVSSQSFDMSDKGKWKRSTLEADIEARPVFQGAFIEDDMMDRVEEWGEAHDDAEPANALAVRFDGWGNLTKMQEFNIDWTLLNEADLTLQRIFSYDALNRRNGETIGSAGSTLYTDLTGNVIEERQWGIHTTQNVFSPVTGELILRDRDTDNNASSGASTTPAGIDQRIYALYDGQGNISAITNSAGSVIERYFYSPEGQLTITDPAANTVRASSNYDWRYLYQGGRLDGTGSYRIGSSEWDYLSGGPLEQDAQAYWNDHLAITPESLSLYDRAVLGVSPWIAAGAGFAAGGPAGSWLAYSSVSGFIGGYNRYADGQGLSGALRGGVYDGTGATLVWGAINNQEIITGADLGWSEGQRWVNGVLGGLQLAGPLVAGSGKILSTYADDIALSFGSRFAGGFAPAMAVSPTGVQGLGGALIRNGFGAWVGAQSLNAVFSVTGNDSRAVADFLSSGARVKSPRGIGATGFDDAVHHIATNKDPFWAKRFSRLFKGAGMDLNDPLNLIGVSGHQGPHGFYNLVVFRRIQTAVAGLLPGSSGYRTALQGELRRLHMDVLPGGGLYDLLTTPATRSEQLLAKLIAMGRV
jgi:YD repeat-containing protein